VVVTATNTSSGSLGSVSFVWEVPGAVYFTALPPLLSTAIGSPAGLQLSATDTAAGYVPSFTATGLPPGMSLSSGGRGTGGARFSPTQSAALDYATELTAEKAGRKAPAVPR
jgi:hypothetical protein